MPTIQPRRAEPPVSVKINPGCRKDGIILSKQPFLRQKLDPAGYNFLEIRAYRKEPGRESLSVFRADHSGILKYRAHLKIDVPDG